jgi:hypothetical protein
MEPFSLHQNLENNSVVLSFKGTVTPNVSSGALESMESYILAQGVDQRTRKKLVNVLVECLHNLFHHPAPRLRSTDGKQLPERSSVLMVRALDSGFEISSGNYVLHQKAEWLRTRIDEINGCDQGRLRELYCSVLSNEERTERGGSGLGLIDMARKSGGPISCSIHMVDDICSFFTFTARIPFHTV